MLVTRIVFSRAIWLAVGAYPSGSVLATGQGEAQTDANDGKASDTAYQLEAPRGFREPGSGRPCKQAPSVVT